MNLQTSITTTSTLNVKLPKSINDQDFLNAVYSYSREKDDFDIELIYGFGYTLHHIAVELAAEDKYVSKEVRELFNEVLSSNYEKTNYYRFFKLER